MEPKPFDIPGVFRLDQRPDRPEPAFPLRLGSEGVHEICEADHGDMAAITGFALAASHPPPGAIFWVRQYRLTREHGHLYEAGMERLVSAGKPIVTANTRRTADALWATEEAIRSSAVGLVIAEVETLDFTASRRLTLAASRQGVPLILLLPWRHDGTSAATARWKVSPRPSAPNPFDNRAPGATRWQAVLEKSRQAPHMAGRIFNLELDHETLSLRVVSGLASHPPAPRTAPPDRQAIPSDGKIRRSA
jgi:protein ImuA